MSTQLDKLLKKIDPVRQIGEINNRMNSALRTFSYGSSTIKNWNEYENYLAKFFCHIENVSLKVKMPVHPKMHYHRCIRFLNEEFGPNGEKIAYKMAKTGINGGLFSVLNIIAKRLANFYARNSIGCSVDEYWNKLNYRDRIAAAKEYRRKYGHLIPSDYTEGGPELLAANLQKILEEHPALLKRMRQVVH